MTARLLLFALLAALGASTRGAAAAEATTGIIVGTVTGAGGAVLAHAEVSAISPSGGASATTDARGRFTLLGLPVDTYVVTARASGYAALSERGVRVPPGQEQRLVFHLSGLRTIGGVEARSVAFTTSSPSDTFAVSGDAARAQRPAASSSGLAAYAQGTVQGAIANVPGVDLDPFGNAILRGGRVADAVFEYDSVPIPQGLIAEPGGNVDGAQLPTTGVGSTIVTLAGYENESDNALGGIVNQIPAVGTYPERATFETGAGTADDALSRFELLTATPDLKWRFAIAGSAESERFRYGDGSTFYPSEAATYGLALQSRGASSVEANLQYHATPHDDVSLLGLFGEAQYDQYASPFAGETVGRFDGAATVYPGETDPNAPVAYASGIRGDLDVLMAQWAHSAAHVFSRLRVYQTRYGSSAGGPFWDENGFPDGSISLSETSWQQQYGINLDNEAVYGPHHLRLGAEARTDTSYLQQVVPTADEDVDSHPTVLSSLLYLGDTWAVSDRLELMAAARATTGHFKPAQGAAYGTAAIDPHAGLSYRLGNGDAVRANVDRITVAPEPLEIDRTTSDAAVPGAAPAPFAPLGPQTANDQTYAFEAGGRTRLRLTYYAQFERNLIDVLPFNFRSAPSAGTDPSGVGVPVNVGDFRSHGVELYARRGALTLNANDVRAYSSSASQFAFNDLNAPAVAAGHLFPVGYEPDFTAQLSYDFSAAHNRLRVTPSLSYATGYPYGNGTMVYVFDPATGKPVQVPNDNYVDPGANYYFLENPSRPFNAATNPYIGDLGTPEDSDPNTLRSTPQTFVNLHVEADLAPRLTLVLDVANIFGNFSATAYQNNPYLIGPPGYRGGNAAYAACYGQILAGTVPCAPGLPAATTPYALGNGVPTNDGVTQAVPWSYGAGGYVPQSYPMGRTLQMRLRYRL